MGLVSLVTCKVVSGIEGVSQLNGTSLQLVAGSGRPWDES